MRRTPLSRVADDGAARESSRVSWPAQRLLAYAYYAQFVLHLEPCPLCIFQRVGVFALGVVFLARGAARPGELGQTRLRGAARAGGARHHRRRAAPPLHSESAARQRCRPAAHRSTSCSRYFPLSEVLVKVLTGSGECAKVTWHFLGLAMPAWVLIAALALGAWGLWVNLRRQAAGTALLMSSTLGSLTQRVDSRAIGESRRRRLPGADDRASAGDRLRGREPALRSGR